LIRNSEWFLSFYMKNIFVEMENFKFQADRLNRRWECIFVFCNCAVLNQVSVPTKRHELAVSALKFWFESGSDFYRITIKRRDKRLTHHKFGGGWLRSWSISRLQNIPWVELSCTDTSHALTIHRQPPANIYRRIVRKLPTGARLKSGVGGYCCRCLVTPLLPQEKVLAMRHAKHIRRNIM